ncbi:mannose-1-phosphate guanylyltransferase/mannose-6-phosphate isomerase [Sulfurovum sp. TSL1]|uniref:mannose-1-phosphate guanylyltransferase/mannose-6-phosphate isomerase n=1 Tax=Sulfurovum sp. TSL1 TaxID=2826994 RepID=UPI001CC60F0B|nr:mannose-1-phosphate guanylyltransferase/mannose-6-phosphate isomerase [Sulfurovum sp. TSL1]GIT98445.1 mannose-1-phosphate guanylyltransferase/mannose-6-phosphate isomerase [Sulfurovum sp. TSL1]
MTNIILCGGNGTRLWPLSRNLMPKQFVKLFEGESLFQKTVSRNQKACGAQFIVSNSEQYFLAVDQIEEHNNDHSKSNIQNSKFLLEPVGRNTAPAIALACLALNEEEIVLVTPSDHLIKDEAAYLEAMEKAKTLAQSDNLVTFGITPQYPETGFGYIEANGESVVSFKEKPDAVTAQAYLDAGNYYWNSGMFCFKAGVFLKELKQYTPEIYEACLAAYKNAKRDEMIRITYEDMLAIPEDSIDYAVMEKSSKVKVIPSDIAWSDLGSFESLAEEIDSSTHIINIGSTNNLVLSPKQVATIDVDDLIIIDTADALLVSKKGSSQKVKAVVKELKEQGSELPNIHVTGHRPWGTYTILDESDGYKVKRIVVKTGKRLSLQKHHHRSEHWIVVSGTALVTNGTKEYTVRANESTYIPMGEIHRLENIGKIPLVMIEAQVGEYVGEDDIVRIEDDFARN